MSDATEDASGTTFRVRVGARRLTLAAAPMPEPFLAWQSRARLETFDLLEARGASAAATHPAHLPVLATLGDEGPFPVNLACKGMGPLPRAGRLDAFAELFEGTRARLAGRAWPETLPERLAVARAFYGEPAAFDPGVLAGLEIFEGRTAANLEARPLASLLFVGAAPGYRSWQLNGVVERVRAPDRAFRFLVAARDLFASDAFHLPQPRYPSGFVFHVVEAIEKTPFSRG